MLGRRNFLKKAGATTAAALICRHPLAAEIAANEDEALRFGSASMELQLSARAPEFLSLNIDGLGQGRRGRNIVDGSTSNAGFATKCTTEGATRRVEYWPVGAAIDTPAVWTFEISASRIMLTSEWRADTEPVPMVFHFNLEQVNSTVLGVFRKDKLLAIHFKRVHHAPLLPRGARQGKRRDAPGLDRSIDYPISPESAVMRIEPCPGKCMSAGIRK